ncbi:hypothetical protein F3Y22_tig00117034pilonHSYRG00847 [Hibiscus syriacus]|uniref:RNase H type-1 domain-containing protein n=1 Tax=Hibiscus syriacus TaxID=106335 RepID=A0A6A2X9N8_HIBSY|nr:hypothetical protein F3Y22_tig00117034pilonHSYRG00847 [Hibiscus syriacus]
MNLSSSTPKAHNFTSLPSIWSLPKEELYGPNHTLNQTMINLTSKQMWMQVTNCRRKNHALGLLLGMKNYHITSTFFVETLAILQGLQFAMDISIRCVILKSDAKSIITKLNNGGTDLSTVGSFICDAKHLPCLFQSCKFNFIGRNGNRAAHAMATEGLSNTQDRFWIEEAPSKVLQIVDKDRRSSDPP